MLSKIWMILLDSVVRKHLLLLIILIINLEANAQLDVNKPTVKTPASGLDPSIAGRKMMDVLTPGLKLDGNQNSKITILIGQFLTHKSSFLDLQKTRPPEYKTKFDYEQQILFDELKGALNPEQFRQLMDLRPPNANPENAMSHLFY